MATALSFLDLSLITCSRKRGFEVSQGTIPEAFSFSSTGSINKISLVQEKRIATQNSGKPTLAKKKSENVSFGL